MYNRLHDSKSYLSVTVAAGANLKAVIHASKHLNDASCSNDMIDIVMYIEKTSKLK